MRAQRVSAGLEGLALLSFYAVPIAVFFGLSQDLFPAEFSLWLEKLTWGGSAPFFLLLLSPATGVSLIAIAVGHASGRRPALGYTILILSVVALALLVVFAAPHFDDVGRQYPA